MIIVESVHPKAKIVVGDSDQAIEASKILQKTIKSISGAELPITTNNQRISDTHIYVGQSNNIESFGIEIPSGITPQMNEEGFTIQNVDKSLVIAGNEDWHYRGTIYAVMAFTEGHKVEFIAELFCELQTINPELRSDFKISTKHETFVVLCY